MAVRPADSLFTSRAVFVDAGLLSDAGGSAARELAELSRFFRIAAVDPGGLERFIRCNAIETYASWYVGDAPDIGFRGVVPVEPRKGLGAALRAVIRAEAASRIVVDSGRLERIVASLRSRGRSIVFTNGVFDLLHVGHIRLLESAKRLGDVLIVGINSDDSTRAIKGAGRPVVPQFARAQTLASLRCVDYCVIFTETDPRRLLSLVAPDVLAKGSDYAKAQVVGGRGVARRGGRVVLLPVVEGFSTSATISAVRSCAPSAASSRRGSPRRSGWAG